MASQQLFVGRLPLGTRADDLDKIFHRYGRMTRCDVKQGGKMAYGFIEYEDRRDAEDAMESEQGTEIRGTRIVVEWSKGYKDKSRGGDYRGDHRRSDDYNSSRGRDRDYDRDYGRDHYDRRSYDRRSPRGGDRGYTKDRRSPEQYSRSSYRDRSPDYYRSSSRRSRSRSHERYH